MVETQRQQAQEGKAVILFSPATFASSSEHLVLQPWLLGLDKTTGCHLSIDLPPAGKDTKVRCVSQVAGKSEVLGVFIPGNTNDIIACE